MNAHRTGHQSARRRQYDRRKGAGWEPLRPCTHCEEGTVWYCPRQTMVVQGRSLRCDVPGCTIYRRVK